MSGTLTRHVERHGLLRRGTQHEIASSGQTCMQGYAQGLAQCHSERTQREGRPSCNPDGAIESLASLVHVYLIRLLAQSMVFLQAAESDDRVQ